MIHQITLLICCGLCYAHVQATTLSTTVPFLAINDLILIEANIDGTKGNFIVDTGAPMLFLNKKYFNGRLEKLREQSWDINGRVDFTEVYYSKKLQIQSFEKKRLDARIIDLTHHEQLKKVPIHGILGYAVFKNMELVFDYPQKLLTLHQLDRKGNRRVQHTNPFNHPTDSFEMHLSRHIPFIVGFIGNKRLRFGIDSGAEINLIHRTVLKKRAEYFSFQQPLFIRGFSKRKQEVKTATLSHLEIEDALFNQLNFAIMDLKLLRSKNAVQLDGILGNAFIQHCKMSINYRKKKLYLWQTEQQQLAVKKGSLIK